MSNEIQFAYSIKIPIVGDELDFNSKVRAWCRENNVDAALITNQSNHRLEITHSIWRIENPKHMTLFLLKWL